MIKGFPDIAWSAGVASVKGSQCAGDKALHSGEQSVVSGKWSCHELGLWQGRIIPRDNSEAIP